jgi:hypothetical protein
MKVSAALAALVAIPFIACNLFTLTLILAFPRIVMVFLK